MNCSLRICNACDIPSLTATITGLVLNDTNASSLQVLVVKFLDGPFHVTSRCKLDHTELQQHNNKIYAALKFKIAEKLDTKGRLPTDNCKLHIEYFRHSHSCHT